MKELTEILKAAERLHQKKEGVALATIVKTKGSTYRRPGARMLMAENGEMIGSISGGCLEGDVFEHAKKVMKSGEPVLLKYDTSSDDDVVWGLGLGCNGVVHVLVESLPQKPEYFSFMANCIEPQNWGVIATVFNVQGDADVKIGSRILVNKDGNVSGLQQNQALRSAIHSDAQQAIQSGHSMIKEYELANGKAEVFIEVIQSPMPLVIFGAGHDAIPVVRLAKELGWNITVVDGRPAFATKERFPQADNVILSKPEDVNKNVSIDPRGAAIIMTHNYNHDVTILRQILPLPVRYLGVLGPKRRTQKTLEDLRKEGIGQSEDVLNHVYSPIGIDIGAETPEEIALAIISEIQAVLAGRAG
ncbi:MAG TPA: XdhC/CoxI family protein, partial [Acidobacteriota bacterium]|nr:XdhC/CoxI family protein [Acidobacteriota bacterium]